MEKKSLRKEFFAKRANIENRYEKSKLIQEKLRELDIYINAKSVFVFISYKTEVNTHEIIDMIKEDGKKLLVPLVIGKEMVATEIDGLSELKPNKMGILEPEDGEPVTDIDLTITPGLAFDDRGYRLGYGGGFYDKFFEKIDTISLAIGFEEQRTNKVFNEEYDRKVDYLLTDKSFIKF
ncbi:5-formyltetrahydrofolate cyclo-ligase [Peptoniphilus olsenii]|uniref:5-formyltetrahydrofolate cyclo-ligase n=1 Tax=Peptoniphilus olsenii TaxID=411570 RepID=A0ABV2JAY3_9FIRM